MLAEEQITAIADELAVAERDRTMVPLLTQRYPGMTIEDSYAVQQEWRRRGHLDRHAHPHHVLAFKSRRAFIVTRTVAPVSARMAGHRPVSPTTVVTRNTAFNPNATAMFCLMLTIVRFDRSTIAATSATRP